jgi:hypothetical protein
VDDQHPTVETWTVAPPPPPSARRRRLGPGLLAAVMAVLILLGGAGLYAARQSARAANGAGSAEAAAAGLLGALDDKDVDRAARFLDGDERLLLTTYRGRLERLLGRLPVGDLTARDLRFRQVAGGGDVAVLQLVGGTVGVTQAGGARVELPVDQLDRRLAEQTKGAVTAVRVVTLRSNGRWHVALLATAAEHARLAARGLPPDYQSLTGGGAGQGAASAEAAVRGLADAVAGGPAAATERLAPAERRVYDAYAAALAAARPELSLKNQQVRVEGLRLRTEPVADGVVRVHLVGGKLITRHLPGPADSVRFDVAGRNGMLPYVVAIQRDGTWYASLSFTVTDWLLAQAEREHP